MKKLLLSLCLASLGACAGTDDPPPNGGVNNTANNTTPNNTAPNSTANNGTPNATPNNGAPNATPNNDDPNSTTNNGNANSSNNDNVMPNANNAAPQWRALIANGDLTGDTSSWNVLVFDGETAGATQPTPLGSGSLAVARSDNRAFVADLDTGTVVVLELDGFTEVDRLEFGVSLSTITADGSRLLAASSDDKSILQYDDAAGGMQPSIPLGAFSSGGSALSIRDIELDGDTVVGVVEESAPFPTVPVLFVADAATASLVDVDPSDAEPDGFGISGLTRIGRLGPDRFAVGTKTEGILILERSADGWVADETLLGSAAAGGEVQEVVMISDTRGLALTYDSGFEARIFDAGAGTSTAIDGIALPSGLIGASASADGSLFFIGDYGVRDEPDMPWGVAVVETETGVVVDHLTTDMDLPPSSVVAVD